MFNEPDSQLYYEERADYLLRVDPEEYLDYLVADAEWQTLEWDESRMTIEQFVKKHDAMSGTVTGPMSG